MLWWPVLISGLGAKRHGFTYWIRRIFIAHQPAHSPQRQEHCVAPFTKSTRSAGSMLLPVVCHVSCGLRQRHYRIIRCTCAGFTKATCPLLPTNENTVFEQTLRARTTINHNTLISGCPLLITAGHCAEFVYKESEDLADLQAITPPSEQHHRLHLSLWSVSKKSAKSLTKTI